MWNISEFGGKVAMTKYAIECGNCGHENIRGYLPEYVVCSSCLESSWVEVWRELEESP